ncbi:CDP-alcohol phosphatidyltransferase family protein [Candidatus Sumerlaeota bacterium]|nr:CDP-alcohol phosphatidyltransferase family protein [Candidatus Sumerlaeota bacterium]
MKASQSFTGDRKVPLRSPLAGLEKRFITAWVDRVPPWLESYHLTLTTLVWSAGTILFGFLAQYSLHWLWLSSLMLFLQWLTDSFDGAVGRRRDTGLARWGFYMDHFLDFVFMTCVFVGYFWIVVAGTRYLVLVAAFVYACMMVSSFLSYGATGEFKITYMGVGPTEIRLLFIVLNALLIFKGAILLDLILPWVVVVLGAGLCLIVYRSHVYIWRMDMKEKAQRTKLGG